VKTSPLPTSESRATKSWPATGAVRPALVELAQTYLQENGLSDENWRIDVVALEMDRRGRVKRLNLIRNAVWGQLDQC